MTQYQRALEDFQAYLPIYQSKLQAWRDGTLSYRGLQLHLKTMRGIEEDLNTSYPPHRLQSNGLHQ